MERALAGHAEGHQGEKHARRPIIIGPADWNAAAALPRPKPPPTDRNIIVTCHYYDPFAFTYEGAEWVRSAPPLGKKWMGTTEESAAIRGHIEAAAAWAKQENRPLYVGKFGSSPRPISTRAYAGPRPRARGAERQEMSWAYWEFGSGFGAFDRQAGAWREPLRRALVPE